MLVLRGDERIYLEPYLLGVHLLALGYEQKKSPQRHEPMKEPEGIHSVNAAVISMFREADTWDQICKAADAALHVYLKADLLRKELDRHKMEQASSPAPETDERR